MSRSFGINLYLEPFSIAIYGIFYLYCLFRPFYGLWIVHIWFLNYLLHFETVKRKTVYIGVYLVLTYTERLCSTVWYLLSWQVSKLHNLFLTCSEAEERFTFEDFLEFLFMESSIPTLPYFFLISFYGNVNYSNHFLLTLCWSVHFLSWLSDFGAVQKFNH